jgi:glycosyltransferase involved in cell wall biosynthesis
VTHATPRAPLVLLANARLPSQRAQSLQVAQMAAAFARAQAPTTLLYARRHRTPPLPPNTDLWDYYGVPRTALPAAEAVRCVDWIDRVPRALQYVPARLQEQSFAKNAARRVLAAHADARVLSREAESALELVRKKRPDVFLEIHRVPGGRLRRKWLLAAAKGARGIVAISGGVRADLLDLGIDETMIKVEHDGFEAARFARLPSRRRARTELSLPAEAPVVVYTGGLLAWKGADLVVEAARALPAVYFAIAGGMEADVKKLRQRAGGTPNVRIDGFQPPERVALYLAAADLALVPNRSQPAISAKYTSPLKVFEAMAAGVALVASDLPSLREILAHERDALLVPPDDAAALAQAIERAIGDDGLRRELAQNLHARRAEFTWDARAQRVLDWMDSRSAAP